MVEGNDNTTNEPESGTSAPKRRGGLFGSRRGARGRAGQERVDTTSPVESPVDASEQGGASESSAAAPAEPQVTDAGATTPQVEHDAAASGAVDGAPAAGSETTAEPQPAPTSPIPATLTTTSLIFHAPPVLVQSDRPERPERG